MSQGGTILWLRRDLRIGDHPAWQTAIQSSEPIWPVFIFDQLIEKSYGAAPRWRLAQSLRSLAAELDKRGSRLILRKGEAVSVLQALIAETGAQRVIWSTLYDARSIERDKLVKNALMLQGTAVRMVNASLIFEPWTVASKKGSFYRVFTPYWHAVRKRDMLSPSGAPADLLPPKTWPESDALADWMLESAMGRGADIVSRYSSVGEFAALERLDSFMESAVDRYKTERDYLSSESASRLSEHMTYGELSPLRIWHEIVKARFERDNATEAKSFLRQLAWREFAYHLLYHTPHIVSDNWRPEWDGFPWRGDNDDAEAWRRGITGIEIVDAAMREMYVTGTMHNRARMLAASFLTKHLLTDWRIGEAWFRECLTDWDVASNAMGWQWTAGCGPDAAPYFRIFNPNTQARKFDGDRRYRDRFLAEGRLHPHEDALNYFSAVPKAWGLCADQDYPSPIIDLAAGRRRALDAYKAFRGR